LGIFPIIVHKHFWQPYYFSVFGTPENSQITCPKFSGGYFSSRFLGPVQGAARSAAGGGLICGLF